MANKLLKCIILSNSLRSPLSSSSESNLFYSYWLLKINFSCFVLIYSQTELNLFCIYSSRLFILTFKDFECFANWSSKECNINEFDWFIFSDYSCWLKSIDILVMSERDTLELSPATKSVLLTLLLSSRWIYANHSSCLLSTLTTESPYPLFSLPRKVNPYVSIAIQILKLTPIIAFRIYK